MGTRVPGSCPSGRCPSGRANGRSHGAAATTVNAARAPIRVFSIGPARPATASSDSPLRIEQVRSALATLRSSTRDRSQRSLQEFDHRLVLSETLSPNDLLRPGGAFGRKRRRAISTLLSLSTKRPYTRLRRSTSTQTGKGLTASAVALREKQQETASFATYSRVTGGPVDQELCGGRLKERVQVTASLSASMRWNRRRCRSRGERRIPRIGRIAGRSPGGAGKRSPRAGPVTQSRRRRSGHP